MDLGEENWDGGVVKCRERGVGWGVPSSKSSLQLSAAAMARLHGLGALLRSLNPEH